MSPPPQRFRPANLSHTASEPRAAHVGAALSCRPGGPAPDAPQASARRDGVLGRESHARPLIGHAVRASLPWKVPMNLCRALVPLSVALAALLPTASYAQVPEDLAAPKDFDAARASSA